MYDHWREVSMPALLEVVSKANGYITPGQAASAGIPRRRFAKAVAEGELVQVDRGLYALPDVWEDPYLVAQHRFSRGVFSDDTALYLHGLTDRAPFSLTMTFPRAYNAAGAREAGITCRTCADDMLELGLCELKTPNGNTVRAYDLERTLCDIVRGQKVVDIQLVTPAMQAYARKSDRDPAKLMRYAKALGVEKKIRTYLEVLL